MACNSEGRVAVFLAFASADILSMVPGNLLQTVADSKDRDLNICQNETLFCYFNQVITYIEIEHCGIDMGRLCIIDRVGRSGQNDTLGLPRQIGHLLRAREHFGIDIEFTETASDQMAVLGSINN